MKIHLHPFNDSYGISTIAENTTKLILGTFPAHQVTSNQNPRLDFYYGSTDNKFWQLFQFATDFKAPLTVESIHEYLRCNNFGILDIIRKCYRKNDQSSADEDLCIIEFEDIISLLSTTKISTVFSTSNLATKLLKQQIVPLLNKLHPTEAKKLKKADIFAEAMSGDFQYESLLLPQSIFSVERALSIKTLYSPSDNAKRGIAKGLNAKNLEKDISVFRQEQYNAFFES